MKSETIEQILKVIAVAAERSGEGFGVDQSYQYGVSRVSQEYNVAYQTIGDACRRRLDFNHIDEFKNMLKDSIEGKTIDLQNVILGKSPASYHERIKEFFNNLKDRVSIPPKRQPETFVSYTIQLKVKDSDVLKALSQLQGEQPEEILAEIVIEAVKERMKEAVSNL